MKNNDCEIVKDLSIQYIEDMLSSKSREFVDNHLLNCEDCKKYYNNMNSNIFNENSKDNKKDKIEINHLKKIKSHINFLKGIITSILIIIIVFITVVSIKYYSISNVINETYNKLEYMKSLDNYKLVQETINKNFLDNSMHTAKTTYYYKDGKYKIELGNGISYLEDNSYNKICVYNDLKQIDYCKQDFIEKTKGNTLNIFSYIINYKTLETGIFRLGLSLREDRFNRTDCYVIRRGNNNSYRDIWIDKKYKVVLRMIEEEYMKYYCETIYTFSENIVKYEDVDSSILNTEKYKDYEKKNIVINNASEELKDFYNRLNQ